MRRHPVLEFSLLLYTQASKKETSRDFLKNIYNFCSSLFFRHGNSKGKNALFQVSSKDVNNFLNV